jgi:hypothetical protein
VILIIDGVKIQCQKCGLAQLGPIVVPPESE